MSVIVTTYNRPDALAAVLRAFASQTDQAFELLIADDGSTDDTRAVVDAFKAQASFPVQHIWQDDVGFRAARIRNQALACAQGDYVIFTDGDCIPLPYFVASHRRLAEPGWFLSGNRVLLSATFTQDVLAQHLAVEHWSMRQWWGAWHDKKINRPWPFFTLPDNWLRYRRARQWRGAKTCNLSAWHADLVRVNGLDESFTGWGLEDSDLVIRLLRAGVQHKSARFAAPVLHLWHPENDRGRLEENQRKLDEVLRDSRVEARIGLKGL